MQAQDGSPSAVPRYHGRFSPESDSRETLQRSALFLKDLGVRFQFNHKGSLDTTSFPVGIEETSVTFSTP